MGEEEEKIKDTRDFAGADRLKRVAVTEAEMEAEREMVKQVKAAEAEKQAAAKHAETIVIQAEAERAAAEKTTDAKKMLAEATQAEQAAPGLADAQVITAKADAIEKQGTAEAIVLQRKAEADARGKEALAQAVQKQGTAEATVLELKFSADAKGITQKAEAMKLLDGVGKEHEEFKLRLNKEKEVELAAISVQKDVAVEQARLVGAALENAKVEIVGGETKFFESIVNSVTTAKQIDRWVGGSQVLTDVKNTFFDGDGEQFSTELRKLIDRFGVSSDDVKNLSVAALIGRLLAASDSESDIDLFQGMLSTARRLGLAGKPVSAVSQRS